MKIEINNVSQAFGHQKVLENISLRIDDGGVYSLVGPNGAGKTTILRILLGIYFPDAGSVLFDGIPLNDEIKSDIGFVLEGFYLYKNMTAEENVELFYRLYNKNIDKAVMKHRVNEVISLVGLSEHRKKKITFFSQGMKQRLCIARSIVNKPKLLVLDEPLKGLDIDGKWEIRELIKTLRHDGCTIFMNSHDMYEVEKLSTKIAIIKEGIILEEGSIVDIRKKHNLDSNQDLEEIYREIVGLRTI